MKKTIKMGAGLRLQKQTVRRLGGNDMTRAAGGLMKDGDTSCTPANPGPGCSHTTWTKCDYEHSAV